jgi:hypothetical protein
MKLVRLPIFCVLFIIGTASLSALDLETPGGLQPLLETDMIPWSYYPLPEDSDSGTFRARRFYLMDPETVREFSVGYRSADSGFLVLETDDDRQLIYGLPEGDRQTEIILPENIRLTAFSIFTQNRGSRIFICSVSAGTSGNPGPPCQTVSVPPGETENLFMMWDNGGFSEETVVTVRGEGRQSRYAVTEIPGLNRLYLYEHETGFRPESVTLERAGGGMILTECRALLPAGDRPIAADHNTILRWPLGSWRNRDFEIFTWSAYPVVHIMVFRDLDTQSSYLKRLAFHQEKKHFRGILMTDDQIRNLRGWNAHDYSAEGLADFFNQAEEENFPLNEDELALKEHLLRWGILILNPDGTLGPGWGSLITLHQERSFGDRLYYITHESCHGLYFTDPDFREEVYSFWEQQPAEAREVWELFLWKYSYDTGWRDLIVNEYQAYLLQKPLEETNGYFNWKLKGLFDSSTEDGRTVLRFLNNNPRYFGSAAAQMDEIFFRRYGLHAGDFRLVRNLD